MSVDLKLNYPGNEAWKERINEYFDSHYEKIAKERIKQEGFNSYFNLFCKLFNEALDAIDKGQDDAWNKALSLLRHPGIREIMYNLPDELYWVHHTDPNGRQVFLRDLQEYVDDYQQALLERIKRLECKAKDDSEGGV